MIIKIESSIVKKKLNKFKFIVICILLFSCSTDTSNYYFNCKKIKETEKGVTFKKYISINNIYYSRLTVVNYDNDFDSIYLIKKNDTIKFEKDELYICDSIYDVNKDNKKDFNITYQSTKGNVIFSYLFDSISNGLSTTCDTLYNY